MPDINLDLGYAWWNNLPMELILWVNSAVLDISPYTFAWLGVAFAIGFSVVGSAMGIYVCGSSILVRACQTNTLRTAVCACVLLRGVPSRPHESRRVISSA